MMGGEPPVIIIFGAGLRSDGTPSPTLAARIEAAARFGDTLVRPLYLPTGGVGRHGDRSEASAMRTALCQRGIPSERIVMEETARDTFDSVIACRTLLARRTHRGRVYAATSAYHLPRCLLLLRLAGLPALAVPPASLPAASGWRKRWYWRLREIPAIGWDALLMLLRRIPPDLRYRLAMRYDGHPTRLSALPVLTATGGRSAPVLESHDGRREGAPLTHGSPFPNSLQPELARPDVLCFIPTSHHNPRRSETVQAFHPAADADRLFKTFRYRSDQDWLDILVRSLRATEIEGVAMPSFPDETMQRDMHGHSGEVSLCEAHAFYREVKAYAAYAGRPLEAHRRLLDFGCGWGRMLRMFMKDIAPDHLYGTDATSRFLTEARRCNPNLNFLSCAVTPPMMLATASLDYILAWSVFSHLDEFLADRWVEEFARLLKPGGLLIFTTQSRRFIGFCAEMRQRRAAGATLEHGWFEACADSFTDERDANARYDAGQFLHAPPALRPDPLSHYGEAVIPRGYVVRNWGAMFRLVDFVDDLTRLPQALVVLQRPGTP